MASPVRETILFGENSLNWDDSNSRVRCPLAFLLLQQAVLHLNLGVLPKVFEVRGFPSFGSPQV